MAVAVPGPGRAQEFERAVGSVTDISPPSTIKSLERLSPVCDRKDRLTCSLQTLSVLEIQVEKLLGDRVPGAIGIKKSDF